jgi:hypothetical protein
LSTALVLSKYSLQSRNLSTAKAKSIDWQQKCTWKIKWKKIRVILCVFDWWRVLRMKSDTIVCVPFLVVRLEQGLAKYIS